MSPARAEPTKAAPKVLAADVDPCKELGNDASSCKAVAKLTSKAGTVTLYRTDGALTRLAMVVDTGTERLLSPPFDQTIEDCGTGSCTILVRTAPQLRQITATSQPAIALEITSAWRHTKAKKDIKTTSWKTRTFVVCSNPGPGWSCLTASYGTRFTTCTASLSDAGIKSTCTRTEKLEF